MDLPFDVRRRVYIRAGVPRDCFINLVPAKDTSHGYHDETTYSLLLTSRKIYEEVVAEVYGNNSIYIRYSDRNSLDALSRLKPLALRSLTSLTIHLNVASCGLGRPCDYSINPWCTSDVDVLEKPLSLSGPPGHGCRLCKYLGRMCDRYSAPARLSEWHSVWKEKMLPTLDQSAKLRLKLVCDVADLETGRFAVRPLMEMSNPGLLDCSIRLSHRPIPDLMKLAQNTVENVVASHANSVRAASTKADRPPFRFTDLPMELRQHILTYTNLVAPHREVEWNADHGYYYRDAYDGYGNNLYPHTLHGQSLANWDPEEMLRVAALEDFPRPRHIACWDRSFPLGCYCRARHAAYSSSLRCECWSSPKSLFLVSRSVREDALFVFFSHNRFVVIPSGGKPWRAVENAPEILPASKFLRQAVPKDALHHLRDLEIVFPAFGEEKPCAYCPLGSPQALEWGQTLRGVEPHLNLPRFTICIYFAEWESRTDDISQYREHMTRQQVKDMYLMYVHTVSSLRLLHGLGKFFMHCTPPKPRPAWTNEENWLSDRKKRKEDMHSLQTKAERLVMDDVRYDSAVAGKDQRVPSRWLIEYKARSG